MNTNPTEKKEKLPTPLAIETLGTLEFEKLNTMSIPSESVIKRSEVLSIKQEEE